MNRVSARAIAPARGTSDAKVEARFGRVIRTEQGNAGQRRQLSCAALRRNGAHCQNEILHGKKYNGCIAVLMIDGTVRMMIARTMRVAVRDILPAMMMPVRAVCVVLGNVLRSVVFVMSRYVAILMRRRGLNIPCKGIGKMCMMVGVVDTVHEGDIRLPRQHDGQRHANHGDKPPKGHQVAQTQNRHRGRLNLGSS